MQTIYSKTLRHLLCLLLPFQVLFMGATPTAVTDTVVDRIMQDTVRDVNSFWSPYLKANNLPTLAPSSILHGDQRACGYSSTKNSAKYCDEEQRVVLPYHAFARLWHGYGFSDVSLPPFSPYGLQTIIAHEYGHNVGFLEEAASPTLHPKTIEREQVADCYSGAFMAWRYGETTQKHPAYEIATSMYLQMATSVHGSGTQRVAAFELGWNDGYSNPYVCSHTFQARQFPTTGGLG